VRFGDENVSTARSFDEKRDAIESASLVVVM
jgi:hypothetical protein